MDPKFEVLWGSIWWLSCWSLPCRLTVHAAVFIILVPAKFIPEQLLDPICHFFFFPFSLSSNSYHILPDMAQILLHLQQQTSALGRYSWPRMFKAKGCLGLLALGSPRKASIPNDFSFSFWELTNTERLKDNFIKLPLLEWRPLQKLCCEMCGSFSFFFPISLHYRSIILL